MRTMSLFAGPVGLALSGAWAAVDIASPSYKVTIPCVIHIAMLRKKLNAVTCPQCSSIIPDVGVKFCSECGQQMCFH